ncbi:MAG: hypothetical protein IPG74_01585 [Flavobacteriales bacterium]|nr:hypothetical protein [Flavobacteriales bacterium]
MPTLTQEQRITYTKAILDLSKKRGDHVLESVTTAELGYLLVFSGNSLLGTELAYTALDMAQHHDNAQALGIIYIDLAACIEDSSKRIAYLRAGLAASERAGDRTLEHRPCSTCPTSSCTGMCAILLCTMPNAAMNEPLK